jgi:hypothetical protein
MAVLEASRSTNIFRIKDFISVILNNVITNKTQRNGPAMLVSVELIIMLMDAVHGFIPYGRFSFIAHKRFSGNSFFALSF